jgi:hypothetical protein
MQYISALLSMGFEAQVKKCTKDFFFLDQLYMRSDSTSKNLI